ncbi:Nipped-B-like protein A [Smittium culicis]|uniref:Nipped-B-like protein A n=1 Tax=Smittium culicis TaxID=133412 RepID=A0A1R1YJK4_9FUNG|nr:Nipped-B-like protein A [Smittium culicis]OMJ27063.1 Nipped-B-like protein A [Smittium culicis]
MVEYLQEKLSEQSNHCFDNISVKDYTLSENLKYNHTPKEGFVPTRKLGELLFVNLFDKMLEKVKDSLGSNFIAVRSKALKALSLIASKNPKILALETIKPVIKTRLRDVSPLVRESAVELLGKFLFWDNELMDQYFRTVCSRIVDKGPLVRKRVLKILKDIYFKTNNIQYQTEICFQLFMRLKDEERSVKEFSFRALKDILIISPAIVSENVLSFENNSRNIEKISYNSTDDSYINSSSEKLPSYPLLDKIGNNNDIPDPNSIVFSELPQNIQKNFLQAARVLSYTLSKGIEANLDISEHLKKFLDYVCDVKSEETLVSENVQGYRSVVMLSNAIFELLLISQDTEDEVFKNSRNKKTIRTDINDLKKDEDLLNLVWIISEIYPRSLGNLISQLFYNLCDPINDSKDGKTVLTIKIYTNCFQYISGIGKSFLSRTEQELLKLIQCSPQQKQQSLALLMLLDLEPGTMI